MASQTVIQIKKTSVSGRAANSTTLSNPAELALNITDGIMYSSNGTVVFEIGANNTNVNISNTLFPRFTRFRFTRKRSYAVPIWGYYPSIYADLVYADALIDRKGRSYQIKLGGK